MPGASASPLSPRRRRRSENSSVVPSQASPKRHKLASMEATVVKSAPVGNGALAGFQPQLGAKRLVIQNLRKVTDAQSQIGQYYDRTQRELSDALQVLLASGKPSIPLERLYRGVEDLCRAGKAERLHALLKSSIEHHLQGPVLSRLRRNGTASSEQMLSAVLEEWTVLNKQTILLRSTFSYLDRTYLLRELHTSINDMMISQFRRTIFPSSSAQNGDSPGSMLLSGLCELVDFDRIGDNRKDADLTKRAVALLYILSVYTKHFEPLFLSKTRVFLKDFAGSRSTSSLKEYIKACEKLIQNEQVRFLQYNLESTTQKQMMEAVHQVLIHDYTDKLLNEGSLTELLREHDLESLKALYDLLSLAGIESKLKSPWASYVMSTAKDIISDKERGDEMTVRLLTLRRGLDVIIRDSFQKSNEFKEGMRGAFGSAMNDKTTASCWNTGTSKVAEMIAKHFDLLLRGGLKAIPKELLSDVQDRAAAEKEGLASSADEDAELDRQLNQALELCRHVQGKDTFEAFYKKDLARRLLMGRSASSDAERNMISKLRDEAGSSLTQNIETMFKDQEIAKEEMNAFRDWDRNTLGKPSDLLHVMVLSSGAWPTYPDVNLNLPEKVAAQHERFDKFYQHKHSGRVLTWKHCLGHVALTANFPKGRKELFVSAFQASVLLLFNSVANDGVLSYDEIKTGTNLQGGDLDRTLQSLACGKSRVLTKHPKGKDVKSTDTFTYNKAFTDPKVRVKINQIQLKETKEENKAMHERIAQDRRFETQAAIVRIMKSRKQMGHAELVAEVIAMTSKRGSVEPPEIKKEIENLIEKDYIDREENTYVYQA